MAFKKTLVPRRCAGIIIAALLFTFSFAPSPLWFLIFFFVPVFIATHRGLSFKEGFVQGYWFGFLISVLLLYWVAFVTVTGVILLIFAHSLYYALIGGMLSLSTRRYGNGGLVLLPFVWIGVEYLRSLSQISFPWLNLSYTQWENLAIVQLSELSADAVVGFFILVVGILLYLGYRSVRHPARAGVYFLLAIAIYSGAYVWGASRFVPLQADLKVAVLQGNVPNEQKWQSGSIDHNFRIYQELTEAAAADSAKLAIWPETAAPCYLNREPGYQRWVASIASETEVDILTGALFLDWHAEQDNRYYNSAYHFTPQGMSQRVYHKIKLVPFSEHIPYEEQIGLLDDLRRLVRENVGLDISDFRPGDSVAVFDVGDRAFGPLICFEVVYPEFVRKVVNHGADFLAVITNDAWFGETAGPYQHAVIPVFRAVENRCWVVRAANTGISEVIDPLGRIVAHTRLGERNEIACSIGRRVGTTLFQRHGPLLSQICLAVTLVAALTFGIRKRKSV